MRHLKVAQESRAEGQMANVGRNYLIIIISFSVYFIFNGK